MCGGLVSHGEVSRGTGSNSELYIECVAEEGVILFEGDHL